MTTEPIGVYEALSTKRAVLVENLSPAARHAAFPKVYPPVAPFEKPISAEELRELHSLRLEKRSLLAKVARLEVRIETMRRESIAAAGKKITAKDPFPKVSADKITDVVCRVWGVSLASLQSPSRELRFVRPRQAAYLLMSDTLHLSLGAIGKFFNRDHTTVMHGLWKTTDLAENDPLWRQRYEAAKAELAADIAQQTYDKTRSHRALVRLQDARLKALST